MQTRQRSYYCAWWKADRCTVSQPVAKGPQGPENEVLSRMSSASQQIGHSSLPALSSGPTLPRTLDPSQCLSAKLPLQPVGSASSAGFGVRNPLAARGRLMETCCCFNWTFVPYYRTGHLSSGPSFGSHRAIYWALLVISISDVGLYLDIWSHLVVFLYNDTN